VVWPGPASQTIETARVGTIVAGYHGVGTEALVDAAFAAATGTWRCSDDGVGT
jgi:hypothetical protein